MDDEIKVATLILGGFLATKYISDNSRSRVVVRYNNYSTYEFIPQEDKISELINIVRENDGEVISVLQINDSIVAEIPNKNIKSISQNDKVEYVIKDGIVKIDEQIVGWQHEAINSLEYHTMSKGGGVVISVIDTGANIELPEIKNRIVGYYNSILDSESPEDVNDDFGYDGHGTSVCATIAAEDNGEGILGIAPESSILVVKGLSGTGEGYVSNIIKAIDWSIDNGADIINISASTEYIYCSLFENVLKKAYDNGIFVVCSSGNTGLEEMRAPGSCNYTIRVSALCQTYKNICPWSTIGEDIDFVAPGNNIFSITNWGGIKQFSGTSYSSPIIAAIIALIISKQPYLSYNNVYQRLIEISKDMGEPGKDKLYGYGLPFLTKGVLVNIDVESTHPYENYLDKTWIITEDDAKSMKIRFSILETEEDYDFVEIYDMNNILIEAYSGIGENFWSSDISGNTIKVRLVSDKCINGYGFKIDLIEKII